MKPMQTGHRHGGLVPHAHGITSKDKGRCRFRQVPSPIKIALAALFFVAAPFIFLGCTPADRDADRSAGQPANQTAQKAAEKAGVTPQKSIGPKADGLAVKAKAEPASGAALAEEDSASAPSGQPRIEVETLAYDMGVIASTKKGRGQIKVYNRGDAPLIIQSVKSSCGCTKAKMAEKVIAPGGEAILEITVDPAKIPGFKSTKTVTILTNDPKQAATRISVTVRVQPEIEWEPEELDFGEVDQGGTVEKTILVRQLIDGPFEITDAKIAGRPGAFQVELEALPASEWRSPDHREYWLKTTLTPEARSGIIRASVTLTTSVKRRRNFRIPIRAIIKGAYTLNPRIVNLHYINPGESFEKVLTVSSDNALEVISFTSINDNLSITHHPGEEPNSIVFDVAVVDNPIQNRQNDTWTLKIKAGEKEYTESVRVVAVLRSGEKPGVPVGGAKFKGGPGSRPNAGPRPNVGPRPVAGPGSNAGPGPQQVRNPGTPPE